MSSTPPLTTAAATSSSVVESTIAPALFLLVPLFTLALLVLALSHRPQQGNGHGYGGQARPQARAAYAFIGGLAVLSTLAGALPLTLSHTGIPQQAEAVVQALLCFLLGVPALHLASTYAPHDANRHRLLGIIHSSLLVMALSGATLLALLAPFLPPSSTPQYLPPALFLVYSALALPRIALTLFRFLHPSSSASLTSTSSSLSTSFFLRSRAATRRPITIHVSTHRTSIPLSLPSPASSAASFPLSDSHNDGRDRGQQAIELEIALPKRKDSRSRLNEDRYLYQDQDEKHQQSAARDNENEKHPKRKHEKNTSVDSSTSTVTAVDHAQIARYHRSLSPPLISLTSPPRAVYTSAVTPPPFSSTYPRVEEHLYRFPQLGVVTSNESNEDHSRNSLDHESRSLRLQLIKSRSRSLLVFLCAAQLTLLVGYACALGADLSLSSTSISISASTSPANSSNGSASASLRIVQAACTVLAVTGTMSAYLLHAYNTHLSNSRQQQHQQQQRTPAQRIIDSSRSNSEGPHLISSMSSMPHNAPASASASAYPRSASSGTTTSGLGPVQTIDISAANASGNGSTKPVIIQLAPPPPPRMRRKRVDALGTGISGPGSNDGSNSSSSPSRSNEERRTSIGHIVHDVSYTYPYSNSHSHSTQELSQQSQHQHQLYPPPPLPLPKREPIVLTYVPPKTYGETQTSLLEVTETEDVDAEQDLYLEDLEGGGEEMGMGNMDGDLDLEDEMQKALSRTSSMATTMSGLSVGGRTRRRTSVRKSNYKAVQKVVVSSKPKMKKAAEDPATYIRKRGSVPVASHPKRLFGWEFGWDPLPASQGRGGAKDREREREREREMKEMEAQESSFMDLRGATTTVMSTTSATTTTRTATRKLKRYSTPAGPTATAMHKSPLSRDAAKLEKLEDIFGLTSIDSTASGGARKLKKRSKSASRPATAESAIPMSQQPSFPNQLSHTAGLPVGPSPPASGSGSGSGSAGPATGSFDFGRGFGIGHRTIKSSSSSGKTSRPGTGESKNSPISQATHGSKVSLGSASSMKRGGLQLKKSFKMGVGRTLGPGLTLASAGVGAGVGYGRDERAEKVKAWEKEKEREDAAKRHSDERDRDPSIYAPTMDDEDVDGEIRSIAAARLVSASIARVTLAATIMATPATPSAASANVTTPPPSAFPAKFQTSPVNINYPATSSNSYSNPNVGTRPTLPAIITSPIPIPNSPAKSIQYPYSAPGLPSAKNHLSPTSAKPPYTSGSTWKPHPFADPVESPAQTAAVGAATLQGKADSSPEDDVVQLEREMEEIRSRGDGGDGMDSPSAPFKTLAAFAAVPVSASASASPAASIPAASISASMSPSVASMFALAQAQAQTVAPPLPMPTKQSSTSEKAKGKRFGGGHLQKRTALSSPPAPTSNWGPQQSPTGNGGSLTGGFPYKFPMIFPHSFTGGSPPRSSAYMNQPPQQSTSTPGTPKGGSTLRLSAMTMGTVRNAFAGVGARMSSATMRMSVNGGAGGSGSARGGGDGFGEMIMEDEGGDFMDLRDPFASPPSKITITSGGKKNAKKDTVMQGGDDFLVIDSGQRADVTAGGVGSAGARRRMSAWGKLPMPVRSFSPAPSAGSGNGSFASSKKNLNAAARAVRIVGKPSAHRKHKKRSRKASMTTALGAMHIKAGAEDADFGIEEALLSQRLLSRLDTDGWEIRA